MDIHNTMVVHFSSDFQLKLKGIRLDSRESLCNVVILHHCTWECVPLQ